jgi:Tol biopolymer transport system component
MLDSDDAPTDLGMTGDTPRFSPDGARIAFATAEAIQVMDAQGENARDVVSGDLSYLTSVAWFPDGERLAFTSENGVEIVDVESGSRSVLADGFATKGIDVSADGTKVVYGVNGQKSLTIIDGI